MVIEALTSGRRQALLVVISAAIALLPPAVASAQDEVVYYHIDAIGSVRMVTDASGAVIARYDYLPFGERFETVPPATYLDQRQFAGKERDSETGLDYFAARFLRGESGRFITTDPVLNIEAALSDPQRWNRYAYALNNPLRNVDPDGRDPVPTAWNTGKGADGFLRLAPGFGKWIWNTVVSLNSPGHISSPDAQARRDAQFRQAATTEEAVVMSVLDVAVVTVPLMGISTPSRASLTLRGESMLTSVARGRGMFGLGTATAEEALQMGKNWVGNNYRTASDGTTLISENGLRQFRPPSFKPKLGKVQANFESRTMPNGKWINNGHLDIYR